MTQGDYSRALLALCLWREARGEDITTKRAVAWSIMNRVAKPSWWGKTLNAVLVKRWQYSSMTAAADPNLVKWPEENEPAWIDCLFIVDNMGADPTGGATHYFDRSLDGGREPDWTTSKEMMHCFDSGAFHFYKAMP